MTYPPHPLFHRLACLFFLERVLVFSFFHLFTCLSELAFIIIYYTTVYSFYNTTPVDLFDTTEEESVSIFLSCCYILSLLLCSLKFFRNLLLETQQLYIVRVLHLLVFAGVLLFDGLVLYTCLFTNHLSFIVFIFAVLGHCVDLTICNSIIAPLFWAVSSSLHTSLVPSPRSRLFHKHDHDIPDLKEIVLEVEQECYVCYTMVKQVVQFPCEHHLHTTCFKDFVKATPAYISLTCPLCRKAI